MEEVAPSTRIREGSWLWALDTGRNPFPECGGEGGVDIPGKVLPLGVELLKVPRSHARILRGIHLAPVLRRDVRQAFAEVEGHLSAHGKVQSEGDAGRGKRHQSGGLDISKDLDHCEE